MIPCLNPEHPPAFPPVTRALRDPAGLLAAGGLLEPEWILAAYRAGIFPWFSEGDPILWWSPDPRMVLRPGEERISASLRKTLRRGHYEVRCDTAFRQVIDACAAPRSYADGTWIVADMQEAYCHLHELGWAHSVETWIDGELVGGLYGVAMGRVFCGESMFHRATDASKIAFAHLARLLAREGFAILDCQMNTTHLASLGAAEIPRHAYVAGLKEWTRDAVPGTWPADFAQADWRS
ncbi:leucyl/phenylalanyl-tRNA--protein transferase [Uliginosibacterium aquaticum]|uniref:Leucyl/phenylalanyl-tRNA--protein transferase n=1 Tax=Uliginosibacterium aquaticum TaxID=2731212 RepID=A0ABX2IMD7_9RHOO|nr:leucyl/phenylalanyl-tRNA--protein transferase [Uliginosibacterium aquaticum]NSL57058.1 leucyl/phenylalanyl-tRNA--protein transferase [Uliginosibacterium aquaticum]